MSNFQALFDETVLRAVNGVIGRSDFLDRVIADISDEALFKGAVIGTAFWWLWFTTRADQPDRRSSLLATICVTVGAIALGRLLAVALPFRMRPIHMDLPFLELADGIQRDALSEWSAMPSDHALMYVAFAASVWHVSRRAGGLLMLHALLVISLPRIMLGLHWPTDVLAGVAIGAVCGFAGTPIVAGWIRRLLPDERIERHAPLFYAALFFVTLQISVMFDHVRQLGSEVVDIIHLAGLGS